jgi:hypothetical protein
VSDVRSEFNSKSKVNGEPLWRHAEKRVEELAPKLNPDFAKMKWQSQKVSKTQNSRLDLWGYSHNGSNRHGVVIDTKYVDKLTKIHLDQVNAYSRHPFYAKGRIIVCRKDTFIPGYFADSGIDIYPILPSPNEFARQI